MVPAMFKHHLRVLEADLNYESGSNLEHILSELADKCPHIEHLRIQFWGGQCFEFPSHPPAPSLLEASELGPGILRDIRLGRKGYSGDGSGLAGTGSPPDSIQAFVRGLRQPCRRVSIGLLAIFAESFSPALRKLGLQISFQNTPSPPNPPLSFPSLEELYVGTSELDHGNAEVAEIFAFLSALLPQGIRISTSNYQGPWYGWERSVFDPRSRGSGRIWCNALSRMLAPGETVDISAELDRVG